MSDINFLYPRPNLKRNNFKILNGLWNYKIINKEDLQINDFDGNILVPFCLESEKSLVNKKLNKDEILYYHTMFKYDLTKDRLILHFEAVDFHARVYLNKEFIGEHFGGYNRFSFDITPALALSNVLEVFVVDNCEKSQQTGKQSLNPKGIFYTSTTGIYQSVWLEEINNDSIIKYHYTYSDNIIDLIVYTKIDCQLTLEVNHEFYYFKSNKHVSLKTKLSLWDIDNPNLHEFIISNDSDIVKGYFALRKIELMKDSNKYKRFNLNNKTIFLNGILYQGYHNETNITCESDEVIIRDLLLIKKMGFNSIRVHEHVESLRFYYLCDKLGLIVMQDMVSGGRKNPNQLKNLLMLKTLNTNFAPLLTSDTTSFNYHYQYRDKLSRVRFENELIEMIDNLHNFSSISLYTIFNEGWGQFDSTRLGNLAKRIDPSRIYNYTSGWYDFNQGEIKSLHIYFRDLALCKLDSRMLMISECGAFSFSPNNEKDSTKYELLKNSKELYEKYSKLMNDAYNLIGKGLSAIVYTQFNDIEQELNGLVTSDRKLVKINIDQITMINSKLKNYFEEELDE